MMGTTELVPPRPHRTQRWVWGLYAVSVILAVAVLWLLFRSAHSDSRVNGLNGTVTVLQRQVAGGHDLARQVSAACRTEDKATLARLGISCAKASSVAAQHAPSAISGAPGSPGRPPTAGEIRDAVTIYCAAHASCTGTPSRGQVQAAVEAFCAAGACTGAQGGTGAAGQSGAPGEPGVSGSSGQPGAQGSQGDAGAQGPGPSTDEIAAAVSAFCAAHGDCTGPAGPTGATGPAGDPGASGAPGAPGATGPAGRGIASIDCSGLGIAGLVIHYDDGTSATVSCTFLANPTESESHS